MLSGEYKKFVNHLLKTVPKPNESVEEVRETFEKLMADQNPPKDIEFYPYQVEHIPVLEAKPHNYQEGTLILFFHAGKFNTGSAYSHRAIIGTLAQMLQMKVIAPDYRLSPENPFPAALTDCTGIYNWSIRSGYKPDQIILIGCAAGGNLVLSSLLSLKKEDIPLPRLGILLSPWADLTLTANSLVVNEPLDVLRPKRLEVSKELYLQGQDAKNPFISPIFGNFEGLPPLLVHVGDREILLDDALHLKKTAEKYTIDIEVKIFKDMIHAWHIFAANLPEAKKALDHVVDWIKEKTS